MPNISRDTATQQITDGPVESYSADLDGGYTVNFGRFRPGMGRTRRQPGKERSGKITRIRYEEVSTLSGDCRGM